MGRSPLHYAFLSNGESEVTGLLALARTQIFQTSVVTRRCTLQRSKGRSTQLVCCWRAERRSIGKMPLGSLRLEPLCSTRAARVTSFNYCAQMVQTLGRPTTLAKVRVASLVVV
jgi:hypothetical protein